MAATISDRFDSCSIKKITVRFRFCEFVCASLLLTRPIGNPDIVPEVGGNRSCKIPLILERYLPLSSMVSRTISMSSPMLQNEALTSSHAGGSYGLRLHGEVN